MHWVTGLCACHAAMHALNTARATLHHGRAPVQTIALRVRNNRETDVPLEWMQWTGWRTRVHDGLHGASSVNWVRWGLWGITFACTEKKSLNSPKCDDDVVNNVVAAPPRGGRQQRLPHGTVHKDRRELQHVDCRCGRSRGEGFLVWCGVGATRARPPQRRPALCCKFLWEFCHSLFVILWSERERQSE